jgi:diguanylate cyclase (GGDEF)-like protein
VLASNLIGHSGRVAAIYLDLDRFKPINDTYGHDVGDQLLKAIAERLRDRIRTTDQAGRHGGDEFLVVCPGIGDPRSALALARRVQSVFEDPFHLSGISVNMSASVGVAGGGPDVAADELVSCADSAMYDAKKTRGGPPIFRELPQVVRDVT